MILVDNVIHIAAEVQLYIISSIKKVQFTMAQMFQDQWLNQVQKVSTIQHALQ